MCRPSEGLLDSTVADFVGKDEVVVLYVERLPGAKQHICERWYQKRLGAAASAVQQQHCIVDVTVGTTMRASEGAIVQVQGAQGLTVAEEEIRRRKGAFFRLRRPGIGSPGSDDASGCIGLSHGHPLLEVSIKYVLPSVSHST